ncbi:hypothetical protein Hanom_Chr03g00268341 [Helianthus anomalus]
MFAANCSGRMFLLGYGSSLASVQEECSSWVWFFLGLVYRPNESFVGCAASLIINRPCISDRHRTYIRVLREFYLVLSCILISAEYTNEL